jgi:hypothetical protein
LVSFSFSPASSSSFSRDDDDDDEVAQAIGFLRDGDFVSTSLCLDRSLRYAIKMCRLEKLSRKAKTKPVLKEKFFAKEIADLLKAKKKT